MTAAAVETLWRSPVPVSIPLSLAPLQRGPGDPTQRRDAVGAWWRTARTPVGPGTLRLEAVVEGVAAQAWGPGADWLLATVPDLLGSRDDPAGFEPRHPLLAATLREGPHLRL